MSSPVKGSASTRATSSSSSPSSSSKAAKKGRRTLRNDRHSRLQVIENEIRNFVSFDRRGYGWCHTSLRKPTKAMGYVQPAFGAMVNGYTPRPYLAHQLVWMHHHGEEPPNPKKDGANLSHLCGNAQCIRADHIYREDTGPNNRRKGCVVYIDCVEEKCEHHSIIYVCNHEPRCIRYHPAFSDHREMEAAFPQGSSHFRACDPEMRDNTKDDRQLRESRATQRRLHLDAVLREHRAAGSFAIKRHSNSIDGPHSSSDEGEAAASPSSTRAASTTASNYIDVENDNDDFYTAEELQQERKLQLNGTTTSISADHSAVCQRGKSENSESPEKRRRVFMDLGNL